MFVLFNSESSVKQMVPNDSFSMAMGALGGGVGGNGAAAAAVTSAMTPQTMAQIQESVSFHLCFCCSYCNPIVGCGFRFPAVKFFSMITLR